ncbi:hypothetical protein CYR55_12000 [Chimaeribacter californicus]|uniref:Fimbrial-type adhesion domain-containing protein n=1 Tax=Chimaeribacter californicus TaxID=2060067 RepID=A0A2N5E544_9GAMM|nr:fimbrial protein [Chimaeribacter californicus]PLR36279.1 hypothetical protein CYR55_12000 [Chimaeribacter californicus]
MFKFLMKIVCVVMAGFSFYTLPAAAANNCSITSGSVMNIAITIPTLRPASNGTSGTVLGSAEIQAPGISYNCGTNIKNTWRSKFTRPEFSTESIISNVYQTNIPGLGIKLSWPSSRAAYFPSAYPCNGACSERADIVRLEFIQTGTISAGIIPAGQIGVVQVTADTDPGAPLTLMNVILSSAVDIQPKSCAILTTYQNVDLGSYSIADFTSKKITKGVLTDFELTLDCPVMAPVKIAFTGEQNIGAGKGIIKNCDTTECAKSVEVKLMNSMGSVVDVTGEKAKATNVGNVTGKKTLKFKAQIVPVDVLEMTPGKVSTYAIFDIYME